MNHSPLIRAAMVNHYSTGSIMKKLIGPANRHLNYLRVSVTDRCNLRCKYCMPLNAANMLSHKEILRFEEILRLIEIGVRHGINKIRITGGEPLVRPDIDDFFKELCRIRGLKDISLTTNGVLLKDHIDAIRSAGIKRINISLDSMEPENFQRIAGRDYFNRVWEGIQSALDMGFHPIKINMVPIRGINEHELLAFAELSIQYPLHVRFIEYMPIGQSAVNSSQQMLTPEIKEIISSLGELDAIKNDENDGPAFRYKFKNARGEVGFISPISHHFCARCNRLRLTARGMLRACLLSDRQVDIRTSLRDGSSDEEISCVLLQTASNKPHRHTIGDMKTHGVYDAMSGIGG